MFTVVVLDLGEGGKECVVVAGVKNNSPRCERDKGVVIAQEVCV